MGSFSKLLESIMHKSILKVIKTTCVVAISIFSLDAGYGVNQAEAASCRGGQGIGTHRTITLNTGGGKRYGKSHGGAQEILKHKEVVLTFDDGPVSGTTPKILHVLDQHCAKATFFMVGTMAKNNPSLARKIANKGHTVGIHSYSHKNLGQQSGANAISDVNRSISTIEKAVGRDVAPFFRFPYLSENRSVNQHLKRLGYGVFAIDVDSLDYKFSNPNSMVNRVMSELNRKGKGIILLHDIQRVTAKGIDQLLKRLDKNGYKIVHIRGRGGKDPSAPVVVASAKSKSENESKKPIILASNTEDKPRKSVKKRKTVTKAKVVAKKKKTTRKKVVAKKKITTKQALRSKKNPIRAKIKKRIVVAQVAPKRKTKVSKRKPSKANKTFARNKKKVLARISKNRQAFRNAIKKRIIN